MPLCGTTFSLPGRSKRGPYPSLSRKLVVVGDGAIGKTALLHVFLHGSFPDVYEPTVFENHVHDMVIAGQPLELSLYDTAGQEDFDKLRALSYVDTHVILLCFAVDNPTSLSNIEDKWIDEIAETCPGVKICLVACKCDLRSSKRNTISYDEGLAMARRIGASRYLECSARDDRGINEAVSEAASVALATRIKGEVRAPKPRGKAIPDTQCVTQ